MRKNAVIIPLCLVVFLFAACAKKFSFANSPVVPGAKGKVTIKKDRNNNYDIKVNTVNLTPSKNLTPAREVYVVWMEGEDGNIKKFGQIKPSSAFLSKAYKGELSATTTIKPKRVFITAEDNGNVEYPGSALVLSTED
jgi:hypothetical protein